jgi:hypothetical protein
MSARQPPVLGPFAVIMRCTKLANAPERLRRVLTVCGKLCFVGDSTGSIGTRLLSSNAWAYVREVCAGTGGGSYLGLELVECVISAL